MKTFFLDIDGVVYRDNVVNTKVLEIIKNTQNKYIFCTGRGYARCLDIVKEYIDNDDEIVLETGGYIKKGKIELYYNEISTEIKKIIGLIHEEDVEFIIFAIRGTNEYYSFGKDNLLHVKIKYTNFTDFLDFLYESKVCQITLKFKNINSQNMFLKSCKNKKIEYKLSEDYVIINNSGVSKKTAIEYIIQLNNLNKDDCIVVGNDYNDIDMFDINCYKKIGILDMNTPEIIKQKATDLSSFDDLPRLIKEIL